MLFVCSVAWLSRSLLGCHVSEVLMGTLNTTHSLTTSLVATLDSAVLLSHPTHVLCFAVYGIPSDRKAGRKTRTFVTSSLAMRCDFNHKTRCRWPILINVSISVETLSNV